MDPSRRKKYFALLALAGVALMVDRFVLSAPPRSPQRAAAATPPAPNTKTPADAIALSTHAAIPALPFPRDLSPFQENQPMQDLFARPGTRARSELAFGRADNRDDPASSLEQSQAAVFEVRHHLDGMLSHPRLKIVVVDGRPITIGQSIEGCKLTETLEFEAHFACYDATAVLKLKNLRESEGH